MCTGQKDFQSLNTIKGRTVQIISASSVSGSISFVYGSFNWEFKHDYLWLSDSFHKDNNFPISLRKIKRIFYSIDDSCEKMIEILTYDGQFTIWSKIEKDEMVYGNKPLTKEQEYYIAQFEKENPKNELTFDEFDKIVWRWQLDGKDILISVEEPICHQQVLANFRCNIINDSIFIDGENTTSNCLILDRNKISCIVDEKDRLKLFIKNGIEIGLKVLNSPPKIWVRDKMRRAWDRGGMYEYK